LAFSGGSPRISGEQRFSAAEGSGESLRIEFDREEDGRWIAEIPELPGVIVYGETQQDAEVKVTALALRVLAARTEQAKKS
jgi:predicted RNase H-like HicB family nuclease